MMNLRAFPQSAAKIAFFILCWSPIISTAAEQPVSEEPVQTEYFDEDEAVLDMDGMAVTGNQELPKSLMVVPWQEPGAGDLFAGEFKSLIDIDPAPIDRREFNRELDYYRIRTNKNVETVQGK